MADQFYFIVTPSPADYPNGLSNAAGSNFFLKFGDGLGNTRYPTHNPTFRLEGNNHTAGSGTYGPPGSGVPGVRIGKFVETYLLAAPNGLGLQRVGATEWYSIRPGPGGIAALRTWLVNLLNAFPGTNFDGTGAQTADQVAWAWIQATRTSAQNLGLH